MAKLNVVRYRSDKKPGMRLNWVNLFTLCLAVIWSWVVIALIGSDKLTRDALWGVGFAVLILVVLGVVYQLAQATNKEDAGTSVVLTALVVLILGVAYNVFNRALGNNVADQANWGLLVSLVGIGIIAGNVLTSWWPHNRSTHNWSERRQQQPAVQPVPDTEDDDSQSAA